MSDPFIRQNFGTQVERLWRGLLNAIDLTFLNAVATGGSEIVLGFQMPVAVGERAPFRKSATVISVRRCPMSKYVALLQAVCAVGAMLVASSALKAQERPLTISPRAPAAGASPNATFTDRAGTWQRVSASELYAMGPQYPEAAGVPIRRGTLVPNYVEVAPLRNVSIRGLQRGRYYMYFGTPEGMAVIVNPSTMRVARMVRSRI